MLEDGGFTVLPPVVAETRRAYRLDGAGVRAASAARVLRIVEPARIVSAPPDWRDWLCRSWPAAAPPAAVLFPRGAEETKRWRRLLAEGWARGAALAADIFGAPCKCAAAFSTHRARATATADARVHPLPSRIGRRCTCSRTAAVHHAHVPRSTAAGGATPAIKAMSARSPVAARAAGNTALFTVPHSCSMSCKRRCGASFAGRAQRTRRK